MNHEHKLVQLSMLGVIVLSLSVLSDAASAAPQQLAADPNAQAIVDTMRSAVHADALDRAGRMILEGMVETKGLGAKARIAVDPTTRSAAIYAEDGGPAGGAEGVDGATTWRQDATGVTHRTLSPSDAQDLVSDAYWAGGGLANVHWQAQVRYVTSAKIGTENSDVLAVTPAGGASTMVWVAQKSHLPLQWSRRNEAGMTVTTYADYRNVEGAMIPFQRTTRDADGSLYKYQLNHAITHADQTTVTAMIKMPTRLPADFDIQGARSTTVALRLAGQPYVDVYIDGRGPYNFLVDTSGVLSLSTQAAQKIGLPLFGRNSVTGASGRTTSSQYGLIADLRIGDAHVRQQNIQVLDLDSVISGASRRHVDGVIGSEVMERFVSTFDFPNQKLTLSLGSPARADLALTAPPVLSSPSAANHVKGVKPGCIRGVAEAVYQPQGGRQTQSADVLPTV